MASDGEPVLVTGASGFIATHIIQQLQEKGYRVRGTVRSTKNEKKIKALRELCPNSQYPLELVEADLNSDEGWMEAVQGCQYVLHTASPFPNEHPKHEDELIKPAVDGTMRVLRACAQAAVRKVVLTSSIASVTDGITKPGSQFSEEDWTEIKPGTVAYYKSKTMAERAAWDFVRSLSDAQKFELAVINPSYVVGPVLCGGWATSMEIPKRLLERKMPALPRLFLPVVDVRDVATAHVTAMTDEQTSGKRHILSSHDIWFKDMAKVLDEEFKGLGYNVPTHESPYFMVKFMSLFDKTIRLVLPTWGKSFSLDNTRMKTVLGINPRPYKESFIDMAYSMIERGFIKKTSKYRKRKTSN